MKSEIVLIVTEEANKLLLSEVDEQGRLLLESAEKHIALNLQYKIGQVVTLGTSEYEVVETYQLSEEKMKAHGLIHRNRVSFCKIKGDGLEILDFVNPLVGDDQATSTCTLYHWEDKRWSTTSEDVCSIMNALYNQLDEKTYKFLLTDEYDSNTQLGTLENEPFQAYIYVENGIRYVAGNHTLLVYYRFYASGHEYSKIALLDVTEKDTKEDVIHKYFQDYFGAGTSVEERGRIYFSDIYRVVVQSAKFIPKQDAEILRKYL